LIWTNTPPGTASFVLHMHEPDVARNRTTDDQVHWLVWNIPGTATGLPEGVPKGEQLPDGSRQVSASGPGVPRARRTRQWSDAPLHIRGVRPRHQLDVQPTTDAFETRANVMKAMQGHVLGKAVYVGLFRRPQ
jgi:phosphatidylethanolamine-binding protein (PEBP) family uncharacterized protein